MDKTEIRVIAEGGWSYAGKNHECGKRFHIDNDQVANLQKYLDDQVIEVVVPTRVVDEQDRTKIITQTVDQVMTKLGKADKSAGIRVTDLYDADPEYVDKGGFSSFSDYAKQIYLKDAKGNVTDTMKKWLSADKAATSMGEAIDSEGGVLAPAAFSRQLLTTPVEQAIVRPRAQFVPVETNSVEIPAIDASSHASNLYGGVLAYWVDEGTAGTASKPTFGKITLKLNKMLVLAYVTSELLEDSVISLETLLPTLMGNAIAYQEDDKFLNGNGAGVPLGIYNSPAKVTVAKESGQAATTIVTNNITKMYSRMHPASINSSVWVCHNDTFPELANLTIAVGSGGSVVGVLREQVLQGVPVFTLLGRPVIFTEKAATLGSENDIALVDFGQYLIGGKSGGNVVNTSIHLKFDQDETAFKIRLRTDGQCWWKSALTPKNGSNTVSPIVTVAVRS